MMRTMWRNVRGLRGVLERLIGRGDGVGCPSEVMMRSQRKVGDASGGKEKREDREKVGTRCNTCLRVGMGSRLAKAVGEQAEWKSRRSLKERAGQRAKSKDGTTRLQAGVSVQKIAVGCLGNERCWPDRDLCSTR